MITLQRDFYYTTDTEGCVLVFRRKLCACWGVQTLRSNFYIHKIDNRTFCLESLFCQKYVFFSLDSTNTIHILD